MTAYVFFLVRYVVLSYLSNCVYTIAILIILQSPDIVILSLSQNNHVYIFNYIIGASDITQLIGILIIYQSTTHLTM